MACIRADYSKINFAIWMLKIIFYFGFGFGTRFYVIIYFVFISCFEAYINYYYYIRRVFILYFAL